MSYNEHTKKKMQTGIPSDEYRDNYDLIFPKILDAAWQRKGLEAGWLVLKESEVFPENMDLYKEKYASKTS